MGVTSVFAADEDMDETTEGPPKGARRRLVGKYELLSGIAPGGMAELYLARTRSIGGFEKVVALKRILPHLAESEHFVTMFLDEARLAATLNHPNIAQVFDIGVHNGEFFFTMEFVPGRDLRFVQRRCKQLGESLPLPIALTVLTSVAGGLHYAHEKIGADGKPLNIIHRDVSPQNIIATYDGGVKIVDFGVAKAATASEDTKAGILKGKYRHMSPEQVRGEVLDRRSDIFALGTLMWEITTGQRLFRGDTLEVLESIARRPIPCPSTVLPDYPPELEAIVMQALERDREKRFQTTQDMQVALEEFALANRVSLSPVSLSKFMRRIFDREAKRWYEAEGESDDRSVRIASYVTSLSKREQLYSGAAGLVDVDAADVADLVAGEVAAELAAEEAIEAEATERPGEEPDTERPLTADGETEKPPVNLRRDEVSAASTHPLRSSAVQRAATEPDTIVPIEEDSRVDSSAVSSLSHASGLEGVPRLRNRSRAMSHLGLRELPRWFAPLAIGLVIVGLAGGALVARSRRAAPAPSPKPAIATPAVLGKDVAAPSSLPVAPVVPADSEPEPAVDDPELELSESDVTPTVQRSEPAGARERAEAAPAAATEPAEQTAKATAKPKPDKVVAGAKASTTADADVRAGAATDEQVAGEEAPKGDAKDIIADVIEGSGAPDPAPASPPADPHPPQPAKPDDSKPHAVTSEPPAGGESAAAEL